MKDQIEEAIDLFISRQISYQELTGRLVGLLIIVAVVGAAIGSFLTMIYYATR